MRHTWKVSFEAKFTHIGDLMPEHRVVVANGDGQRAIDKARRLVVGSHLESQTILGRWVTPRCRWAKVVGLEMLDSIDA
jgi:hypothetical protein